MFSHTVAFQYCITLSDVQFQQRNNASHRSFAKDIETEVAQLLDVDQPQAHQRDRCAGRTRNSLSIDTLMSSQVKSLLS